MSMTSTESGSVVATYLLLRKTIGWIGTLLPIAVIAGDAAFSSGSLPITLSDYYYTPMRNVLVGSLCVLGVFLLLYDVSVKLDRWITNAAGIGALGVAFLPQEPPVPHLTQSQVVIGTLHVVFAAIAFLGLGATMWRFGAAISDGPGAPAPSARATFWYRASAYVMVGFVIASGLAIAVPQSVQHTTCVVYDFEALAIMTFGVTWLVKGKALQPLASAPAVARILGRRQGAGDTTGAIAAAGRGPRRPAR